MAQPLDIVIPVYNEGRTIVPVLESLRHRVATPHRILICYDSDTDDTLPAIRKAGIDVVPVKNDGTGPHAAVLAGFRASAGEAVLVFPADDLANAGMIDAMVDRCRRGSDIVAASRFMPGGRMEGCPWLKAFLVRGAAWTLYHLAQVPTRDATNGFRLFSRRALDTIAIESTEGFTYSLELLVKAHRLGWDIDEVPVQWFERPAGGSRFRVLQWLPAYLRWYGYAFATTYLRRSPETVPVKPVVTPPKATDLAMAVSSVER